MGRRGRRGGNKARAPQRASPRPQGSGETREAGATAALSGRWRLTVIVIVGVLTYANSFGHPFIFDDLPAIAQSLAVRAWPDLPAVIAAEPESPFASRPLVSVSFALNYALHGLDVGGYHAVNVGLHVLCALLVFGLLRRTLLRGVPGPGSFGDRSADIALAAALIWTVYPLNSEVVNYLTQRTESLMACFYLLTLYAAVRALDEPAAATRWHVVAVLACAAGMASKESMVTAPVMLLLYDRVFVFDSWRAAWRARSRFYLGLAATLVVLVLSMLSSPRTMSTGFATADTSTWHYLLSQTRMIGRYLQLAIWPSGLVIYYGWSLPVSLAEVWPWAALVVTLLGLTAVALARWPAAGYAGAWFFVTLAPTTSFVVIASEVGAERRMYLPMVALVALVVVGAARLIGRWREAGRSVPVIAPTAVVAGLCLALSATTWARTQEYASPLTMAETVAARWPASIGHLMVGTELVNAGRSEEALDHLRQATADYAPAHFQYGTALFNVGRLEDAEPEFRRFLELEPASPDAPRARAALGRTLARLNRPDDAVVELELALADTPGSIELRGLLADAYFQSGQYDRAIAAYRQYLELDPRHAGARSRLAAALAATGDTGAALETFEAAVAANPTDAQARLSLAAALVEAGRPDDALPHAAEAARLDPTMVLAYDLYGRLLAGQGRVPEAIAAFERALALDPTFEPAREALRIIRGG